MAYIYEVSFSLDPVQLEQLKIGRSLEKVIGYMRVLLPSQPGFVSTSGLQEVNSDGKPNLVFLSEWETWEDLLAHRQSSLTEDKVLLEFDPHIQKEHLVRRIYREID
jgi:hypothetical protein